MAFQGALADSGKRGGRGGRGRAPGFFKDSNFKEKMGDPWVSQRFNERSVVKQRTPGAT